MRRGREGVPRSDVGAPLPQIVANDHRLWLSYVIAEPDPGWDGTYANVILPSSADLLLALVEFELPRAHYLGAPNDEAFDGHPLAARGLEPYGSYVVRESSWIRRLEEMNRVHPCHSAASFHALRHFIFAFHDSTFECVARGLQVETLRGSQDEVLAMLRTRRKEAG